MEELKLLEQSQNGETAVQDLMSITATIDNTSEILLHILSYVGVGIAGIALLVFIVFVATKKMNTIKLKICSSAIFMGTAMVCLSMITNVLISAPFEINLSFFESFMLILGVVSFVAFVSMLFPRVLKVEEKKIKEE